MRTGYQKLANWTKIVVTAGVLFFCCFYLMFNQLAPKLTVKYLGFKFYTIQSTSMEPDINKGDVVLVVRANYKDVQVNDVVAATIRSDVEVLHYVAEKDDSGFRTKRANVQQQKEYDFWHIEPTQLIGKHILTIPKIGWLHLFMMKWYGKVTVFISILLTWFLFEQFADKNKTDTTIEYTSTENDDVLIEQKGNE